jgi:hypothetical protein
MTTLLVVLLLAGMGGVAAYSPEHAGGSEAGEVVIRVSGVGLSIAASGVEVLLLLPPPPLLSQLLTLLLQSTFSIVIRDGGGEAAVLQALGVSVEPPPLRSHMQLAAFHSEGDDDAEGSSHLDAEDAFVFKGVTVVCHRGVLCRV